jgi:hypothetical protein
MLQILSKSQGNLLSEILLDIISSNPAAGIFRMFLETISKIVDHVQ